MVFSDGNRGASSILSLFEGFTDSSSTRDHHSVVESHVADDAGLTSENDRFSRFRRTGDACLCDDDVIFSDLYVVGDLAEVIDFRAAADDRSFEAGAVDRRIRSYLYV